MAEVKITCPGCGREISLTETIFNKVKEDVRKEFEKREKEKELEFRKKAKEQEEALSRKLKEGSEKALLEARKKAHEEAHLELQALKEANEEKEKKLEEAEKNELDYRKKARELEDRVKSFELEVERRIDSEKEKVRREALALFAEEHRFRDLEKDKKISDLTKQLGEALRKAEQGPIQAQGEVLELDLEAMLRARFSMDVIEPVPKGVRGADIIERVFTRSGFCGSIAWESKRTRAWNNDWITKLKDDQREVKADLAVIVTETLPSGITSFGLVDGVWVTAYSYAGNLAEALRLSLIQVAQAKKAMEGREEKMEAIYDYVSGPGFRQRVEGIVESFVRMREDLAKEKTAYEKIWSRREEQIKRVIMNTARLWGDMEGIIGATLPGIKILELGEGEEDLDSETSEIEKAEQR